MKQSGCPNLTACPNTPDFTLPGYVLVGFHKTSYNHCHSSQILNEFDFKTANTHLLENIIMQLKSKARYLWELSFSVNLNPTAFRKATTPAMESGCSQSNMSRYIGFPTIWHLACVDSDEPLQPAFKLFNSKLCPVSSIAVIEYSSD